MAIRALSRSRLVVENFRANRLLVEDFVAEVATDHLGLFQDGKIVQAAPSGVLEQVIFPLFRDPG